jgi:hypothetical protein
VLARLRSVRGLLPVLAIAAVAALVAIVLVAVNPIQVNCQRRDDHATVRVFGVSATAQVVVQCRSGFKLPLVP